MLGGVQLGVLVQMQFVALVMVCARFCKIDGRVLGWRIFAR